MDGIITNSNYRKMDIPFTPVVKIVKSHANMELSMLNRQYVSRTNKTAVEDLQAFLDTIGHMVAEEASREAARHGKSIISSDDMNMAIKTVICDYNI